MTITLPYPPSVNNLYATVRGRRVLSREGRQFKETVAKLAYAQKAHRIDGREVCVLVHVHRPRKAGDLDNTLKALLDSLTGIVWADDSQVGEIHARRFEDKHEPRVVVHIKERQMEPVHVRGPVEVMDHG